MPLELSELTLEEALRSYSSVKGHRTRVEKEIGNLLQLLTNQYSATSEERVNDRLEKLEKNTNRLSDIAKYLVSLKYTKARDHREEVLYRRNKTTDHKTEFMELISSRLN